MDLNVIENGGCLGDPDMAEEEADKPIIKQTKSSKFEHHSNNHKVDSPIKAPVISFNQAIGQEEAGLEEQDDYSPMAKPHKAH